MGGSKYFVGAVEFSGLFLSAIAEICQIRQLMLNSLKHFFHFERISFVKQTSFIRLDSPILTNFILAPTVKVARRKLLS
jgi:hypothetical protein